MKLSAWARQQGLSYKTAWRLWRSGKLPVPAEQLATGTVIVQATSVEAERERERVALYARVSSADQKGDLDRQLARLTEYAVSQGMDIVASVREVGSGLNGRRTKLVRLLQNCVVQTIVIEHRDRLTRFGFEYIEAALAAQNRRLLVLDSGEVVDDIVRDLHEVIVSMCARLYGKRSAKNRAKRAEDILHG